jgi:ribosomal protein S18 acetylase RimI-like enzyme
VITLKPITSEYVRQFRDIRLRVLQDTPTAFGSTYAGESGLSDADWLRRASQWNGDRSAAYLAWDDNNPCGIVAGFFDVDPPATAHLASMWVAPTRRRAGVGRLLVNAVLEWARSEGATTLRLRVTSNNDIAIQFYERLGFRRTGKTEPYPNDPTLFEFEMIRPVIAESTSA